MENAPQVPSKWDLCSQTIYYAHWSSVNCIPCKLPTVHFAVNIHKNNINEYNMSQYVYGLLAYVHIIRLQLQTGLQQYVG